MLAALFWLMLPVGVPQPANHPAVGRPSPAFDLVQLIPGAQPGAEAEPATFVGLPDGGSVTLLHFWGTWCPPCKLEYPELIEMASEFGAEPRFRFVTVSCGGGGAEDYESLRSQTERYYRTIGAGQLETFVDLAGATRSEVASVLGDSMVYPTTVLIGSDGRIAGVWLGYSPSGVAEMRSLIVELLGQAAI
jgi:thiol-disulfide isomerase/thioredoxin